MKGEVSPVLLHVLNFCDGVLTIYALHFGVSEANPLMAALLEFGPTVFMFVKCGTVSLCVLLLQRLLSGNNRRKVFSVLTSAYIAVSLWHFYGAAYIVSAGGVGP